MVCDPSNACASPLKMNIDVALCMKIPLFPYFCM